MTEGDGLFQWRDGPVPADAAAPPDPPYLLMHTDIAQRHLWAVRDCDTVHAQENCSFGRSLPLKVIKHTNLTGGLPAFCSGEMLIIDPETVVLNGKSRRYGPRSAEELQSVANAFKQSGYHVASMGFDPDTASPLPFVGTRPQWI